MTTPTLIDQWTTVIGVLLPLLIAVLNRQAWPGAAKAVGAVAVCLIAAAGDVYFKGHFSLGNWTQTSLAIFFLVVTTYVGFWRPTGIAGAIEQKTG